ncbi:coiled-coil domain-containing protein 124-like [Cimex lectularius]|uniref:Coiled-coil domain-containing protein n=1 Tax=Cimex lectularius TaxID=79782 RepID=A0A8I6TB85_CIMLE|nr:coiled-coil domain-containing protein 124-like [Cimex lectularius]XP_014239978.1 coiled-coil domain-containing protein 124-like [Cimex lectularius]
MPKKFSTGNTKAIAAKARKAAVREQELDKKKQELEDALWQDDDKNVQRKQQRKEEKERKKQELLDKKASAKALLEKELNEIKPISKQPASKVFRIQIQEELEKRQAASLATQDKGKSRIELPMPLEENLNQLNNDVIDARNITQAIEALSVEKPPQDRHIERRLKAAYAAYEEKMMPIVKQENPSLRFSQLKQLIFSRWQSSPENPLNQLHNG